MNLSNSELDQLFENVRKEKPVATFDDTQRAFLTASITAVGGVLATKGLLKFFTFKQWIIMISVLSTATVGTLLVTMSNTPVEANDTYVTPAETSKNEITVTEMPEKVAEMTPLKLMSATLDKLKPEMEIITSEGSSSITVKAYMAADGTYHFEYSITAETTEAELQELQEKAAAAGFELKYIPTFGDNGLKRLTLHIIQKEKNGQQQEIHISDIDLEEDTEYRIAWNVDDEGTATTIACGENYRSEEIDKLMAQLDLEELTGELAILQGDLLSDMSSIKEMEQSELIEVQKALNDAQELLTNPEIRASLLEIEEIDQKALQNAMESILEAQEDLAEFQNELITDCKELQKECAERVRKCHEGHDKILDELVSDGLIKSKNKRVKMVAKNGKLSVNGKEVPKNLRKKYEDMIKDIFEFDVNDKGSEWEWSHDED
jgi:hypothetical protein